MAERILPSGNTLVKYDNPVLVTKHDEKFAAQVNDTFISFFSVGFNDLRGDRMIIEEAHQHGRNLHHLQQMLAGKRKRYSTRFCRQKSGKRTDKNGDSRCPLHQRRG